MTIETTPKAQVFSLRTPYLSAGHSTTLVARGDHSWFAVKVYAQGGENALHAHPNEEHTFLVLEGQATFYNKDHTPTVVNRYEGVLLPKGTFYYFQSTGEDQLVMLRAGSGKKASPGEVNRIAPNGQPFPASDPNNKEGSLPGVPILGKFFND